MHLFLRQTAVALAVAVGLPAAADAEPRTVQGEALGGPAAEPRTTARPVSTMEGARRELGQLLELGQGSAVRRRAAAVRALRPGPGARQIQELRVFRSSQSGPYDDIIARAAERWGLDPFLLKGLLDNESRLQPDLVGKRVYRKVAGHMRVVSGGARGIGQFTTDGVAAVNEARQARHAVGEEVEAFTADQVMDPERAIPAAAELLATYIDRFGRDGGITAYNTGPGGGALVARRGFYQARRTGQLSQSGPTRLQGHRFLLNVLHKTNAFRRAAGLAILPGPCGDDRGTLERAFDRARKHPSARRLLPSS